MLSLSGRELAVARTIDTDWRAACPDEPDSPAEQEAPVTKEPGVEILAQLRVAQVGARRANGGIAGVLVAMSERAATITKPTTQTTIRSRAQP